MFMTTLYVALGGAIGAALRFLTGVLLIRVWGEGFPVAIIAVNVIGSFIMGAFVVWSFQKGMTHLNPFVMTGVLGGFTTFSAFSLEAFTLFERGQSGAALAYVALSVVLSLAALAAGVMLARGIYA
ncbi:camphor resistance protein CrcB [Cognatiyoonia koreensis]|uniref:Fluoride-specific ion channel FluC n=1 Tax=Cognatiyoonia koreensis TaxID=364200 RepID=A0A1I0S0C1_9RHOB|nr:fluoride efflux transporter CrcB [Cognatiyoonia koreensis]SEW47339.1 camphor resistance protein CrcB [Cognatiyoonia koreensis]